MRVAQRESTPLTRLVPGSRVPTAFLTRSTTTLDSMVDHFWTLRNAGRRMGNYPRQAVLRHLSSAIC